MLCRLDPLPQPAQSDTGLISLNARNLKKTQMELASLQKVEPRTSTRQPASRACAEHSPRAQVSSLAPPPHSGRPLQKMNLTELAVRNKGLEVEEDPYLTKRTLAPNPWVPLDQQQKQKEEFIQQ